MRDSQFSVKSLYSPKYALIILGVLFALLVAACGPDGFLGFQGYLTDPSGNPISGSANIIFRIFSDKKFCASGGSDADPSEAKFTETHNGVTVTNGLLNVQLGSLSTHKGGIDGIDPAIFAQPLWLEIVVEGEELQPCQRLMGAPYAMTLPGGAIIGSEHEGDGAPGNDDTDEDYASLTVHAGGASGTALITSVTANGDLIRGCSGVITASRACPNLRFRVTSTGAVTADGAFTGGGADFAEMVQAASPTAKFEPGDVLSISADVDRAFVLADKPYDTAVLGVYSTQPGFIGRPYEIEAEDTLSNEAPVAIVGIVAVKVSAENGAIQRGDLLTTSATPGHAMKATSFNAGTILGKALGELESGTGVIEVLLMLR